MTKTQKSALAEGLESALVKIEEEIRLLTANLRPPVQDCSLEPLTKNELIGEANRTVDRLNELQTRRKKLKHAIRHIDDEDFGLCKSCGETIPYERLLLMPETTCCMVCLREGSCPPD